MANIFANNIPTSNAIWLGSPIQVYRMGLVVKVQATMQAGETALIVGAGEGSVYAYPACETPLNFSMFVTSQLFAFPPGADTPAVADLVTGNGGVGICKPSGMDINPTYNYYSPQVKIGTFTAPNDGTYTFAMYWWGGSASAGTGNAACVYPGTSEITAIVFSENNGGQSQEIAALQSNVTALQAQIAALSDYATAIDALQSTDASHAASISALEAAVAALQASPPPQTPTVVTVPPSGVTIQFVQEEL